jgi:hypothetical protein
MQGIQATLRPRDRTESSIGETVILLETIPFHASAAAQARFQLHNGCEIDHYVLREKIRAKASANGVCRVVGPILSVRSG